MTIIKVDARKPSAPNDLTEQSNSTPVAPSNLTEQNASTPANPANLTEQAKSDPAAPSNLTEKAAVTPVNPIGLSELAKVDPVAPANLSEIAKSDPVAPSNLTEVALSTPIAPSNLTEVARPAVNRTLKSIVNLDFVNDAYSENGITKSFADFATYFRASSASFIETFVGPLGRKQKRVSLDYVGSVTNLVVYSENFDNAAWNKSRSTITKSNEKTSFNSTAWKLTDNSTSGTHLISDVFTFSAIPYTFSTYAKADTNEFIQLVAFDGTTGFEALINLATGVIVSKSANTIAAIEYDQNGFYKISITFTPAAAVGSIQLRLNNGITSSYAGVGNSILISAAQLTTSSIPLPYVRTLNVSVTETFASKPRIEENGLLIEQASTNTALKSEDFTDGTHSKSNATIEGNVAVAPDGSFTADLVRATASGTTVILGDSITVTSGLPYTVSIFVKPFGVTRFSMVALASWTGTTNKSTFFDLANGTIINNVAENNDGGIEDVGNGWFRCYYTQVAGATITSTIQSVRIEAAEANTVFGIYAWGLQVEQTNTPTSYIKTDTSIVTRNADACFVEQGLNPEFSMLIESTYKNQNSISGQRRALTAADSANASELIFLNSSQNANSMIMKINGFFMSSVLSGAVDDETSNIGVWTRKENDYTLFNNGEQVGQLLNTNLPFNIDRYTIGAARGSASFALNGNIKRFELYDKAVTANEVKTL